jgi:hypothetical protein
VKKLGVAGTGARGTCSKPMWKKTVIGNDNGIAPLALAA